MLSDESQRLNRSAKALLFLLNQSRMATSTPQTTDDTKRPIFCGFWIIRVYGEFEMEANKLKDKIKIVEYVNWSDFERDCTIKSTSLMLVDESKLIKNDSIYTKRLQRLSEISERKYMLWGIKRFNQGKDSMFSDSAPHLVLLDEDRTSWIYRINSIYEITTHAERMLLGGNLVTSARDRRLFQHIHRLWRQYFSDLLKELNTWQRTRSFKKIFNMAFHNATSIMQRSFEISLILGYNFEEFNGLFIRFSGKPLAQQLVTVFEAWSVEIKLKSNEESKLL